MPIPSHASATTRRRFLAGGLTLGVGCLLPDATAAASAKSAPGAANVACVRIALLRIKPEFLTAFTKAVREGMRAALRREPGVIALYAVADSQDPTKLTFFEMYVDEAAYQQHRQTPHFQKYFRTTQPMIAERTLLEAVPLELQDASAVAGEDDRSAAEKIAGGAGYAGRS